MLDELTTGLDPAARRDTWAMVQSLKERGVTVVLVTHAMDEAEILCDRLVLINFGRSSPRALLTRYGLSIARSKPLTSSSPFLA